MNVGVMVAGGKMAANLAMSYGAKQVGSKALASFFDTHVGGMRKSENEMIARTSRVLEAALVGYGIGYIAPVAIISAGQLILGNPLAAAKVVGTAVILSNPMAATCAAVGALYYGYNALTEPEREQFLRTLEHGLDVGKELIVSLIGFAERLLTQFLNSETLKRLKDMVGEYASIFGKSVADITGSVSDRVVLAAHKASAAAYETAESVGNTIYETAAETKRKVGSASVTVREKGLESINWMTAAASRTKTLFDDYWASRSDGDAKD